MSLFDMQEPAGEATLPLPELERWTVLRAGIQNVWEYDDQRFVFGRGRLLLRGRNESGKTKALELLLPFLLDADLSPSRLDPFGSRARTMAWNLVGHEGADQETRVGYLWLELGRLVDGEPLYCTVGAGLRAKKSNKEVRPWFFLTSRRVDDELQLIGERRVPIARAALEEAVGDDGAVFRTKTDYRAAVNRRLFGMPDEQYDALIEALLKLRRPQLSKQLNPVEVSQLLSESLPPLDGAVLRTLAEGFGRLDQDRAQRDAVQRTAAAVKDFLSDYADYARRTSKAQARLLTTAESGYRRAREQRRAALAAHEHALEHRATLEGRVSDLDEETQVLDARLGELRSSEAFRDVQRLDAAETEVRRRVQAAGQAEVRFERDEQEREAARRALEQAEDELRERRRALETQRDLAREAAADAALVAEHAAVDEQIAALELDVARSTLEALVSQRRVGFAAVRNASGEVRSARAALEKAEAHCDARSAALRDAEDRCDSAEAEEATAETDYFAAATRWVDGLEVVQIEPTAAEDLLNQPLGAMAGVVEGYIDATREVIEGEAAALRSSITQARTELEELRAERVKVAEATHVPPPPPGWRAERAEDRPGAPFYVLCDFAAGDGAEQANVEAALEAAGLLDAWVTPEGELLDGETSDVVLQARPVGGATLAEVLRPTPAGGVDSATIEGVLRTVALVEPASAASTEAPCWIAQDGQFRIGPLRGRHQKPVAAYVGATAREQERLRRLTELDERIGAGEDVLIEFESALEELDERRQLLEAERRDFPDNGPLIRARFNVEVAESEVARCREAFDEARGRHERADADHRARVAQRDAVAVEHGLSAWIDSIGEIESLTSVYDSRARDLLQVGFRVADGAAASRERGAAVEVTANRAASSKEERGAAREAVRLQRERAAALREALGSTRDELMSKIDEAEQRKGEATKELVASRKELNAAERRVGETSNACEVAESDVAAAEDARRQAAAELVDLAQSAVVEAAEVFLDGEPEGWTLSDTIQAARAIDAATPGLDDSKEARDKADNRTSRKFRDLDRDLGGDVRVRCDRSRGVAEYEATYNRDRWSLPGLLVALTDDLARRQRLLDEEEHALFEDFLTGETHEEVRKRLRASHRLVRRMNAELAERPTASGMTLRLRWDPAPDAPDGATQAMALLRSEGKLMSQANREALRSFLRARLAEAQESDGRGTLEERMAEVLDYRAWHSFTIEHRSNGSGWTKLTRKAHSAGSGGQKALLLHLPLFAAAAAFYESAAATAPRLVALDEAFAGIDRASRAQLMGMLGTFGLDYMMTSYDEWGCYAEVDGLAIYNLAREPGFRGVYADWFLWDGHTRREMGDG